MQAVSLEQLAMMAGRKVLQTSSNGLATLQTSQSKAVLYVTGLSVMYCCVDSARAQPYAI